MLSKRLIKSNDAAGGVCLSDETDIFGDGSGVALYQLNWDGSDKGGQYDGVATDVSFVNGKIDSAGSFNGSSSSLDTNYSLGSATNSSFSMWFKTASTSTKFLATQSSGSPYTSSFHIALVSSATELEIQIGSLYDTFTIPYVADNNWHHLVVSRTAASGYTLYLDNSSIGTFSNTTALEAADFYIGTRFDNTSLTWLGSIDQVRIFNKALSASEVTTLYNEVACEKTCTTDDNQLVSNCIAYYKLDGNADDALNTYDGTPTNVSWTQGRFGSAGGFNGSSSKITTNADFDGSTAQGGSISFWFKSSSTASQNPIGSQTALDSGGYGSVFYLGESTSTLTDESLAFWHYDNGAAYAVFVRDGNLAYQNGNWFHCVMTSTSATKNIYINGVDKTLTYRSNTTPSTPFSLTNIQLGISLGTSAYFNGSIDQVRIYDRAITAEEVETLYNEVACPSGASFNTVLYTGNGYPATGTQNVGGVGFQPDLVWVKSRNFSTFHLLYDSVRGVNKQIYSNSTSAEVIDNGTNILAFTDDGFDLGSDSNGDGINRENSSMVAWCWKAGGDAVTNTDGTITSEVSANVDAGFSIVRWDGSFNTGQTIGHGLSQTPAVIMARSLERTSNLWYVHHQSLGNTKSLILQQTSAENSDLTWTNTSTTFGTNWTGTSFNWLAYCFHSVAGFSKFGSYTGTGGSTTVSGFGFEPAFLLIKRTDTTGSWVLQDNARGAGKSLFPDLSAAESLGWQTTFNSDGFNTTSGEAWINASGGTYIYMAFANQF